MSSSCFHKIKDKEGHDSKTLSVRIKKQKKQNEQVTFLNAISSGINVKYYEYLSHLPPKIQQLLDDLFK